MDYMRYLFFDIECCNGWNVCSFGYVVTNELFEIIEKDDIVMNPEAKFNVGRRDIELAYSEREFFLKPFPEFYDRIKQLLELPHQKIFGHSVDNDARYIRNVCERYDMPYINFRFYDTQVMYKDFANYNKKLSLTKSHKTIRRQLMISLSLLTALVMME